MVAAVTYTATTGLSNSPRALHAGDTLVAFTKTTSQFHATLSSAVLLAKIPNKATIIDAFVRFADTTGAVTAAVLDLKVGATSLGMSLTVAAGTARATNLPIKVSLSDDAAIQYALLRLDCTTAGTASSSLSLCGWISYTMDQGDGI